MTLEELSRYSWIRDQIQITRQRLEDMRAALEPRSPRFDGKENALCGPPGLAGGVFFISPCFLQNR